MRTLGFTFLLLFTFLQVQGQAAPAREPEWQDSFFNTEQVLPRLMEAAIRNSVEIEKLELAQKITREDLKIKRKDIFSGIGLGSGYTYGSRIGLGNGEDQVQSQLNAFVLPAQAQYNIGVMVSLPISQVLNRGNELNKLKMGVMQAESDRKLKERQIRLLVINLYQDIVLAKAQLKLHQEAFQTAQLHFKLGEKQFSSGEVTLAEMAKINESYATANIGLGTAKIKYATTFLVMEELIGMKIYDLMNGK